MKSETKLRFRDAWRVKSAEFWMRIGEPSQAWLELQTLPKKARHHPRAAKVLRAIQRAIAPVRSIF